ncbi:pilus assembly protein [Noviherbaspirillum saxi]|nr:PilC/PilY family type IV pilus protein [Noviherbaspirillum saxi]
MITARLLRKTISVLMSLAWSGGAYAAATDISTEPLNTYSATSSTDVKPNVMFVLDDSGSMAWDFMPDWACARHSVVRPECGSLGENPSSPRWEYLFRSADYNGVYYNPAIRYKPPVAVNSAGVATTATYPSMTGDSAATGADSSSKPNWKAVKNDAFGVQSTGTSDLSSTSSNEASFYTVIPGEYCTSPNLRSCISTNVQTTTHPYPAKVRWCNSSALTNCQAAFTPTYSWVRTPSPRTATIIVSAPSSPTTTSVSGITIGTTQIMAGTAAASTNPLTLAQNIVDQINACTVHKVGNCQTVGYSASRIQRRDSRDSGASFGEWYPVGSCTEDTSGTTQNQCRNNVIVISAPRNVSGTPSVSKGNSGNLSFAVTAFVGTDVPGEIVRTSITDTITGTSYPFPGSAGKAADRTDCAGSTCTYTEEMINFANWWTYNRTRMQLMKTAVSQAFSKIDTDADIASGMSRFRLGYMSINNATTQDFLNIDQFKTSQKQTWYAKLFAANPSGGTPLRRALSDAGRLYAGKLNGESFNGSTVVDPLQYSCQQNYTILSTDGFWNGDDGYKMNGTSSVGNQDAHLARPYYDGGNSQLQQRTSQLQKQDLTLQLQSRASTLQTRTITNTAAPSMQKRESSNSGSTWTEWTDVTSCSADNSGSSRRQCRYPNSTSSDSGATWTSWSYENDCDSDNSGTNRTACSGTVAVASDWADTASCTAAGDRQCRYSSWTSWANAASCSAVSQSPSSPYTVGQASECRTIVSSTGPWTNASSCTVSATQNCQYTSWSSWSNATSCTSAAQSVAPGYTVGQARECRNSASGGTLDTLADVAAYYYSTDLRSSVSADGTGTCDGPVIAPATIPNNLCTDNVPSNGRDVAATQHMTTFTLGLGAQGQMIYAPIDKKDYWNDGSGDFYDVKQGTTANASNGICSWQSSGSCNWPTPSADSSANIDDLWHAAINGRGTYFSAKDPVTLTTSLTNTLEAIINTPRPGTAAAAASSNPNVSASDNYVFSSSYRSVEWFGELIRQRISDSGALTAQNWSAMKLLDCAMTTWTPSTNYVVGAVFRHGDSPRCYSVTTAYTTGDSFGTADTANTSIVNVDEAADTKTAIEAPTSRTIYTKAGSVLIPFTWPSIQAAGLSSYFTKPTIAYVSESVGLSQFCSTGGTCLSAAAQDNTTVASGGAAGEALVNFLRGERTNEGGFFRKRTHVLGDIVASEARYVQAPLFEYADANYSQFKANNLSRAGSVYVGANDGMLHAFDATNGKELWAYIPSLVLPNLYKLADKNYASKHQFFVDGTPETGDICPNAPASACTASEWRTILVGGLNRGGKGYYALDITNPASPALLWEFTHAQLGYSYGNPKITKLKDGTWVVLVASGYNNADGAGRLFVLNAKTGALIGDPILTSAGTAATPSGVARISAHVVSPLTDNTTSAAYGGDTLGNLWRFDINGDIGASGRDAHRLITLVDENGAAQPITVRPLEATINGKPVVFAGTGRYLGTSDVANTAMQSFYAVKDNLDATSYASPRAGGSNFVKQTLTAGKCPSGTPRTVCTAEQLVRTSSKNPVDWTTKNGWYIDFVTPGERSVSDPSLGLGTLLFTTITPQATSVSACGDTENSSPSFVYALDYLTGGAVEGANNVSGVSVGSGLVTRPVMIRQTDGTVRALIRTSGGGSAAAGSTDQGNTIVIDPTIRRSGGTDTRRVSWRELTTTK